MADFVYLGMWICSISNEIMKHCLPASAEMTANEPKSPKMIRTYIICSMIMMTTPLICNSIIFSGSRIP